MSKLPFIEQFKRYVSNRANTVCRKTNPRFYEAYSVMDCCGATFVDGASEWPIQNRGFAFSLIAPPEKKDVGGYNNTMTLRPDILQEMVDRGDLEEKSAEVDLGFTKVFYNYWVAKDE